MSVSGVVDKKFKIDTVFGATMVFNEKQSAQINCNLYTDSFMERLISGTKGRIRLHSPGHRSTKVTLSLNDGTEQSFEFAVPNEYATNFGGSAGMIYEVEEVVKCLDEGRTQSPEYGWDEMLSTMRIMDEIRKQLGLTYEADKRIKSKL